MQRLRRAFRGDSWGAWGTMLSAAMTMTGLALSPAVRGYGWLAGMVLSWPVLATGWAFMEMRADRNAKAWQAIAETWKTIAMRRAETQPSPLIKEDGP